MNIKRNLYKTYWYLVKEENTQYYISSKQDINSVFDDEQFNNNNYFPSWDDAHVAVCHITGW